MKIKTIFFSESERNLFNAGIYLNECSTGDCECMWWKLEESSLLHQMTFTNYAIASNTVESLGNRQIFFSWAVRIHLAREQAKKLVRKIFVSALFEINYSNRLIRCKLLYRVFYYGWFSCLQRNSAIQNLFESKKQTSKQTKTIFQLFVGKFVKWKMNRKIWVEKVFLCKCSKFIIVKLILRHVCAAIFSAFMNHSHSAIV